MKKLCMSVVIGISVFLVTACGGGSSSPSEPKNPTNTQNVAPDALIDAPATADERSSIELSASQSTDSDGRISSYRWQVQSESIDTTLEDSDGDIARLSLGEAIEDSEVVVTLTVTDDQGDRATAEHTILVVEIDRAQLPSDPGTASLDTLEGIDEDDNGIRDDVERAIYELHEDSHEDREILKSGSFTLEKAIMSADSGLSQDRDESSELISKFAWCMSEESGLDRNKDLAILKALVINTQEREEVYRSFLASRHGTIQRVVTATKEECMAFEGEGE